MAERGAAKPRSNVENKENNNESDDDPAFGAAGMQSITKRLHDIYPDQKNHLQATALVKFWLGGPDPLDYISMLLNHGDANQGIPEHWHYVSFGFSDLHGDGRVHSFTGAGQQSGFGFELTFRLKRESGQDNAPMWPATLLNSLARYVFKTGNILNTGDHIPWYRPLDEQSQSQIQHMLVTEDPQLGQLTSPYGNFQFRQVVGVTDTEMKAAQRWKGNGVLKLLSRVPQASGPYFVTDMSRQQSIFDTHPQFVQEVTENIEKEGSNLGHVTSCCLWEDPSDSTTPTWCFRRSGEDERDLDSVHLKFDMDAAEVLPIVVKGRLMKGRYFVFQNVQDQVIVFIPPEFTAEMVTVSQQRPIRAQGQALQIYCSSEFQAQMARELEVLQYPQQLKTRLPQVFRLSQPNITITVVAVGAIPVR